MINHLLDVHHMPIEVNNEDLRITSTHQDTVARP